MWWLLGSVLSLPRTTSEDSILAERPLTHLEFLSSQCTRQCPNTKTNPMLPFPQWPLAFRDIYLLSYFNLYPSHTRAETTLKAAVSEHENPLKWDRACWLCFYHCAGLDFHTRFPFPQKCLCAPPLLCKMFPGRYLWTSIDGTSVARWFEVTSDQFSHIAESWYSQQGLANIIGDGKEDEWWEVGPETPAPFIWPHYTYGHIGYSCAWVVPLISGPYLSTVVPSMTCYTLAPCTKKAGDAWSHATPPPHPPFILTTTYNMWKGLMKIYNLKLWVCCVQDSLSKLIWCNHSIVHELGIHANVVWKKKTLMIRQVVATERPSLQKLIHVSSVCPSSEHASSGHFHFPITWFRNFKKNTGIIWHCFPFLAFLELISSVTSYAMKM